MACMSATDTATLLNMQTTAIYPGTFDPITNGHIDLVRRACGLFGHVYVAVAASGSKNPWFSLEERIELARQVLVDMPQVEVRGFSNLMVDFAKSLQASVIIRGLRAASDFEYEVQMAGMNRSLQADIETVFLTPDVQYTFLSSSLIKDIARHHGDVAKYVHPIVHQALQRKLP